MKKLLASIIFLSLTACSMNFTYSGEASGFEAAKQAANEWNTVCHTNIKVENTSYWYIKSYPLF